MKFWCRLFHRPWRYGELRTIGGYVVAGPTGRESIHPAMSTRLLVCDRCNTEEVIGWTRSLPRLPKLPRRFR